MTVVDIYLKCSQLKHDCNIILKEGETTIYDGNYEELDTWLDNRTVERFTILDNTLYCVVD